MSIKQKQSRIKKSKKTKKTPTLNKNIKNTQYKILSNYSKGIYNLTIKTSNIISNHKLIFQ